MIVGEINSKHYKSLAELVREKPSAVNRAVHRGDDFITLMSDHQRFGDQHGVSWFGLDHVEDVVKACKHGWPEGLRQMQETLEALRLPKTRSVRRRRVRGPFGDHLDIQRVYVGDLEKAWQTTEREVRKGLGKFSDTIFVQADAACHRRAHELFWRGAVACILADALERSGRRVRVVVYSHVLGTYEKHPSKFTVTSVSVKDFGERLNLDKLAFMTGLAGFLRVYLFRAYTAASDTTTDGLGRPGPLPGGRVEKLESLPESLRKLSGAEGAIVVSNIWSKRDAQAFLEEIGKHFSRSR